VSPLTAACVPTGMKSGVSTSPWSVVNRAARAREPLAVAVTWNRRRDMAVRRFIAQICARGREPVAAGGKTQSGRSGGYGSNSGGWYRMGLRDISQTHHRLLASLASGISGRLEAHFVELPDGDDARIGVALREGSRHVVIEVPVAMLAQALEDPGGRE